jgi:hypothetical protein
MSYFVSRDSGSETYSVFWPVKCGTKTTDTSVSNSYNYRKEKKSRITGSTENTALVYET